MMNIPDSKNPRIVIIGAGFAGINLVKKLKNKPFQVVLLDKHNYHNFQPLMYQVATGGLEEGSIAYPIRKALHKNKDTFFRITDVQSVDTTDKKVLTDIGAINYDYLVMATGSTNNFFGNKEVEANSYVMKTIPEALKIRNMIINNLELALKTTDQEERKKLMTFVIVGGGPTGVELAGSMAEMKKGFLAKDYPDLDMKFMEIHLIEGAPRVLAAMSKKASKAANKYLTNLGVKIYESEIVTNYDGNIVSTRSEKYFNSKSVIWSAGVKGNLVDGFNEVADRGSRIKVNEFNQVEGFKDVFAIGDVAAMYSKDYERGHPMMAQPAIQQGQLLADNILKIHNTQTPKAFKYNDKGAMAIIGRNKAVVDLPSFSFTGFFAWKAWLFIHLISLIGCKNKMLVYKSWLHNFFTFDRESRTLIHEFKNIKTKE